MASKRKIEDDEGENISRTGRQRKKSAKVLEMEAEADELAQVLRARMDTSTPKPKPPVQKGPRVKKTPMKAPELEVPKEVEMEEELEEDEPMTAVEQAIVTDAALTKSGRVRKKSAKLMEMVEAEKLDRKTFRTSHIPKSMRNALNPSTSTPAKKGKATVVSPVRSAEAASTSPPGLPSTIKHLLSSPQKKSAVPTSPPPEPILATLGASLLASPTKNTPQIQVPIQAAANIGVLGAVAASLGQPAVVETKKDTTVKFLADSPDAVINQKPAKKRSKKQAAPTPSAPAAAVSPPAQVVVTTTTSPPGMPKLKNLLSPPKKPPPMMATSMADQPLLSKMMGEVGNIGPPPPSSAEAKSMKKKAKKELAFAMKYQPEGILKKPKREEQQAAQMKHFPMAMPKAIPFTSTPLQPLIGQALPVPYMADDDDSDSDLSIDQLMIDTTKVHKKKPKKEKSPKVKVVKIEEAMSPYEIVVPPMVEMEQEVMDEVMLPEEDEIVDEEDDDDYDDEGEEVDVEVPTYANTQVMANKLQTQAEKKAIKEKKKKKSKKDDPEKQKKKRGPTAYMLWCNAHRAKLVEENPGIDFATISRRLGEMWSGQTEKDKMVWRKKAKKIASKGSTMITTSKGVSQMVHGGSRATLLNKPAQKAAKTMTAPAVPAVRSAPAAQPQRVLDQDQVPLPLKASGCAPLDVAAHLKLLGESLSIIGARLQEHHGQIAVQGTLPVLLDSLLCALGPLTCLTSSHPQLDGAALQTHASTLDNIAYIMPGIG